jgi:hypothetical protein
MIRANEARSFFHDEMQLTLALSEVSNLDPRLNLQSQTSVLLRGDWTRECRFYLLRNFYTGVELGHRAGVGFLAFTCSRSCR